MPDRPGIAPLAQRQLAQWESQAEKWTLELDTTEHPWVWRCGRCPSGKGVFLATDAQGARYQWTPRQRIQMITLHLRTHHLDLDPDRCVP